MVTLIVAAADNGVIGRDNTLPWHLPDDLKRFKALTLGKPVLMGRRTADSLGRALPGRRNLVLTRSGRVPFAGMQPVATLEEACDLAAGDGGREICVIGGGEVYALCLPQAARLHLTHVDTVVVGADAFFPAFEPAAWRIEGRRRHPADRQHEHAFEFIDYVRPGSTADRLPPPAA
jgi:dihydrofolate reductase